MKKSIFVLSALLTLVVSGICLQSCSSEYDEYTTEEYGCYTEEEINAIKAMAEKYNLTIDISEGYYGPKKNIKEHEKEMIAISSILGEYNMIPQKNENGDVVYTSKKACESARAMARSIEGEGRWSGSEKAEPYDFTLTVTICWSGDGTTSGLSKSGTVSVSRGEGMNSVDEQKDYSSGSIRILESGDTSLSFEGSASYAIYQGKKDNPDDKLGYVEVDCFCLYKFTILAGEVNTISGGHGSFIVIASNKGKVFELK